MTRPVDEIRRRLEERKQSQNLTPGLVRFLVAKGICRQLAQEMAEEFIQKKPKGGTLAQCLMQYLRIAPEPELPCCLTLVGPTGVGKTTTAVKLAHFYHQQGKQVTLASLGEPSPSLQIAAKQLGISYLEKTQGFENKGVMIIDTPGCNFYLPQRVEALGHLMAEAPSSHLLLTLSATTKDLDLYGAIHQFSYLEPAGLIFTKLDETLASGVLLNVSQRTHLPLWYITYGYPLPGEIEKADPKLIANKIIKEWNGEEFNCLRQLIIE